MTYYRSPPCPSCLARVQGLNLVSRIQEVLGRCPEEPKKGKRTSVISWRVFRRATCQLAVPSDSHAMDLGDVKFVQSKRRSRHPVLQYRSRRWQGAVLEFSFKYVNPRDPSVVYYRCISCYDLSTKAKAAGDTSPVPVAHVTLKNSILQVDPDYPSTAHSCDPTAVTSSEPKVLSKRYMTEKRTEIRHGRKRPREAYNDALAGVDEHFSDCTPDCREAIKEELCLRYGFASKRRALSYNRHLYAVRNVSIDDLQGLEKTLDGEDFLRHRDSTQGSEVLVFFGHSDLEALLSAEYVFGDGNFKYTPPEFMNPGQLYSLHVSIKGECHPVVFALTRRRDTGTYMKIFEVIREALLHEFGHMGTLQSLAHWVFDFEVAAINAAISVFSVDPVNQPIKLSGCAFHYAKAVNKKRDELGLRNACRENEEVRDWFSLVRHLPFVPEHLRIQFAEDLMSQHPMNCLLFRVVKCSSLLHITRNFG
ncbi:uncharacterized protein LOC135388374 [Ornithodoros turicata]|uniref:uncharacterized protein LOC135388374 n=1 Tax=Ornithodoros turicata TaxID=34597 RepID=UPI003139B1A7